MVCVTHTGLHSYLHLVPGCANIGASAQKQLQSGMHCVTLLGWPHLLRDCCLHHSDRYAQGHHLQLQYVFQCAVLDGCGAWLLPPCISGVAAQCFRGFCIHLFMVCAGANNKQWKAMADGKAIWIGIVAGVGAGVVCLCTVIPYLRWKIPKEMEMQRRYLYMQDLLVGLSSLAPVCAPVPSVSCPRLLKLLGV